MKRLLLLVVIVLSSAVAAMAHEKEHSREPRRDGAQPAQDSLSRPKYDGAHLAFKLAKHDFGVVERKGGDLQVRFEYVNDGTEPLVITRIATSCTCIRADYRRRPLDVGESDAIELTYEPHKMEAGMFHKVVQVYSNSVDGMRLLTVSGNSVEKR